MSDSQFFRKSNTVVKERRDFVVVERKNERHVVTVGQAGPPGPPGLPGPAGGSASVYTATTPIGGHRVLTMTAGGDLAYASNDDVDSIGRVLGISINAAGAGGSVSVVRAGDVEEPSWDWVVSLPIYLGANGMLTQTPPESPAVFSLIVGFPLTSTSLFFSPREPITLGD